MPSVRTYQGVQYDGFPSGLNKQIDSARLEADNLAEGLNIRLGNVGEVELRTGYTRYDSTLNNEILHVFPWRSQTPTDHLVAIGLSGVIWNDDLDGIFTNSGFNSKEKDNLQKFGVGFAGMQGKAYLSSKDMTDVVSFDGTTWAAVSTIPKGKMLHARHGRLFAINDDARPSAVYFSALLDAETFGVSDYIEFDPDDGYEINASAVFSDDLILFKDNVVWKMVGRTPSSFSVYRIDNHRGCVSPRSVDQIRGRLVFFDRDTGIWAFDGAEFELISQPINDYILANQNYDKAYRASAYVAEDRYYFSLPWTGGTFRTFVYFADTGGWTEYDGGIEDAAAYLSVRYLGLPGAQGLYKADTTSNLHPPSVVPITARFRTGWTLIAGPGAKSRIRRLEATVRSLVGSTVTIRMFRDFDGVTPYVTRTFQGGPAPEAPGALERRVTLDGWGNRLRSVMFEIEVSDGPFQLNSMTIFYTSGSDIRGSH